MNLGMRRTLPKYFRPQVDPYSRERTIEDNDKSYNIQVFILYVCVYVYDMLSIIWKSDLSDKIKRDFFQAVAMAILLY